MAQCSARRVDVVVYADHAIPRAYLAEQWVAKGQQQLLTS
jgi:hypothetical protein